ncbi:Transcriptional regulator, GntR family [Cupriavidus taiwanensis]|uniref:Transcriptional regulator, GntR family n=1 Tax=Cupriavidus taiwanensis TaxID=164546 RepID=A0A9Q7XSF0_9BURK|nr:GntR family transcriptional regulator [Cupriavidus taiwanensis]SPD65239.1 Transcriptional regulator, GntR family [Cupriavidus taiwanensis]
MSSLPTSLTGAAAPGAQETGAATPGAGTQPLSPPAPAPAAAPQAATPTGSASGPAPGLQSVPSPTFSPLYQQIKALITRSLQSGEWKPGEMIPSEMELASRYKVSQGTVRKAIDELAAENLVARRQGKGTFVTTHHEDVVKFRFLRLVPDEGEPHYGASRVLECKRLRAPAEIARLLDIRTGDSVVQIRRVLTFSGESTVLDEIWLLGANFKGLTAEKLTEWKGPMYALFEAEFGTRMIRASEKIRAVPADETAAELLSVPVGAPLRSVERVSYTYGDRPVEVRRGLYVTTRHYYQNDLS